MVLKFGMERMGLKLYKVYIDDDPGLTYVHMTKKASMPLYGENLKNLYLWNLKSYGLEIWHGAYGTQALQSVYR